MWTDVCKYFIINVLKYHIKNFYLFVGIIFVSLEKEPLIGNYYHPGGIKYNGQAYSEVNVWSGKNSSVKHLMLVSLMQVSHIWDFMPDPAVAYKFGKDLNKN